MGIFEVGSLAHEVLSLSQCGLAAVLEGLAIDEVAFEIEVVVDVAVDRGKLLQRLHPPEAQHRAFSSTEAEVRVLGPVDGPAANLLLILGADQPSPRDRSVAHRW